MGATVSRVLATNLGTLKDDERRLLAASSIGAGIVGAALMWSARRRLRNVLLDGNTMGAADKVAEDKYDYIIVGGGTAGCLLANRLLEAGKKVLVLEAGRGDYYHKYIRMPVGVLYLFATKYDWTFWTKDSPSPKGKGVYLCRGRVLGGSSALNVMLYHRGDARDYDEWESKFGCAGWGSDKVLPYFKCTEDEKTGLASKNPKYHGAGGEWKVDHVRYQNPLSRAFLKACGEAGHAANPDFNNWDVPQEGVGRFHVSQNNGSRTDAASVLLMPALSQAARLPGQPLRVLYNTHTCKVNLQGKTAAGVTFRTGAGEQRQVRLADGGEVILAGGAIHSPQLLMLSGIGPAAHLKERGIEAVVDLPGVGENFQDHPAANVSYECCSAKRGISPTSKAIYIFGKRLPPPSMVLQWLLFGSGPLTSPGCDHGGFFKTSVAKNANEASADLQMRFLPARAVTADGMNSFSTFRQQQRGLPDGFSFQSIAVRPHSRGRVRLASADPLQYPDIEGGFLTDAKDVASIREGLRLSRHLAKQPAFAEYLGPEVFPGAAVQSDEQLDTYIKETVHTANAIVGTCRMGSPGDSMAVCDPKLQVLGGVSGLRVCDASVMPKLPGGQSGAPTVMIAERLASMLTGKQAVA